MFDRILIANRGEIAVTIIRACREMGIHSIAVCSAADRDALHAQLADECICIGPAASKDSYLNQQAILTACLLSKAQAIHPGFGFLSENASFARLCEQCGIAFIGPSVDTIRNMGNKANARAIAVSAGVPVIPGSVGAVETLEEARQVAEKIGFPVLIKASGGGGGRGMRIARNREDVEHAWLNARAEARACFGDDQMYLEKKLDQPRHVEIQVLADHHGNIIHLGDRDCSMQRRSQKILEEAVSPATNSQLRQQMGQAAVLLARKAGYRGAGTVEFLLAPDQQFYFMEMNTRIQVEHPITEAVTGINLVQEQIRLAAGLPLTYSQEQIRFYGHAIECRINAEDPIHDFRPSPGVVSHLQFPGGIGVRVDSALYQGAAIPADYDSLIAKIIVHAPSRAEAITRMRRALMECVIGGIQTNIDYHLAILREPSFIRGDYDIGYIDQHHQELIHEINKPIQEA